MGLRWEGPHPQHVTALLERGLSRAWKSGQHGGDTGLGPRPVDGLSWRTLQSPEGAGARWRGGWRLRAWGAVRTGRGAPAPTPHGASCPVDAVSPCLHRQRTGLPVSASEAFRETSPDSDLDQDPSQNDTGFREPQPLPQPRRPSLPDRTPSWGTPDPPSHAAVRTHQHKCPSGRRPARCLVRTGPAHGSACARRSSGTSEPRHGGPERHGDGLLCRNPGAVANNPRKRFVV